MELIVNDVADSKNLELNKVEDSLTSVQAFRLSLKIFTKLFCQIIATHLSNPSNEVNR